MTVHAASGRTQIVPVAASASAEMMCALPSSRHGASRSATSSRVVSAAMASASELLEPKEAPSSPASSSSASVASYQLPGHWERQMKSAPMGKRRVLQR